MATQIHKTKLSPSFSQRNPKLAVSEFEQSISTPTYGLELVLKVQKDSWVGY